LKKSRKSSARGQTISLRVKAMACAVAVLVSMATVIGVMVQRISYQEIARSHQDRIDFTIRRLEDSARPAMLESIRIDDLGRLLNWAVQVDGVVYGAAFDAEGKLLTYSKMAGVRAVGDPTLQAIEIQHHELLASNVDAPIRVERKPVLARAQEVGVDSPENPEYWIRPGAPGIAIGWVMIAYTDEPVETAFAALQRRLWAAIAGVAAMAALLGWQAARTLIRPIYDLIKGTRRLAAGDYQARVEVRTRDELHLLAESFNRMTCELSDSRRKLADHNKNLEETVRQRTKKLREAIEELKTLDAMKDGFLSSISHEFRTPITSIRAFAEILTEDAEVDSSTRQEFAGIILKESNRLGSLVNDILDLVKIEAREMPFHFASTQPDTLLKNALASLEELKEQRNIELDLRITTNLCDVLWDGPKVTRVLRELLDNALRFSPVSGTVVVCIQRRSETIRFLIRDEGQGIPKDHLEAVFTKFRQISETLTGKHAGTGIGLPICRQIVLQHGGEIHAEVPDGPGALMVADLPVCPPEELLNAQEAVLNDGATADSAS
jgi:signal transduction histidine kinase